jgi:hypothetical protein
MRSTVALVTLLLTLPAAAANNPTVSLTIHNPAFERPELEVPGGQKIELHVRNADAAASEFESAELHSEKVVPPGQEIVIRFGA